MEEKKIATSVDVLINVGSFEHLQITKYAEKKITYETPEEMIQKEDQLTDELVKDVIRTMRSMPDKLGKKTDAVTKIEEKINKKIPTWLEEGSEPNIANLAKDNIAKVVAEVNAKKEEKEIKKQANKIETEEFLNGKPQPLVNSKEEPKSVEEPKKEETGEKPESKKTVGLDDDLFGDVDLFK